MRAILQERSFLSHSPFPEPPRRPGEGRYNGSVPHSKFRVGLVQMACSLDPNQNLAKAEWRIREAAGRGAQIVCVQELFRSQYFCREEKQEFFDLAESIPGPTSESFTRLAALHKWIDSFGSP